MHSSNGSCSWWRRVENLRRKRRGSRRPAQSRFIRRRRAARTDSHAESAPTMAAVRQKGVHFANPHSLFPTFTMPNASAMATGHFLADTGVFSNTLYAGLSRRGSRHGKAARRLPENDPLLGDIDAHFAGDFIDEATLLKAARAKG